jgi:hypothetical protein
MRFDEAQGRGDVVPLGERRDLKTRAVAITPLAGGADQLPGRQHAIHLSHVQKLLEGKELGACARIACKPGMVIRLVLAFRPFLRTARCRQGQRRQPQTGCGGETCVRAEAA